jgi:hypothetical protein
VIPSDNATVRLDLDNEPQPDLLLGLPIAAGGALRLSTDGGYFEGPPELVIEVAASSTSYDLNQKKGAYRRNGNHRHRRGGGSGSSGAVKRRAGPFLNKVVLPGGVPARRIAAPGAR